MEAMASARTTVRGGYCDTWASGFVGVLINAWSTIQSPLSAAIPLAPAATAQNMVGAGNAPARKYAARLARTPGNPPGPPSSDHPSQSDSAIGATAHGIVGVSLRLASKRPLQIPETSPVKRISKRPVHTHSRTASPSGEAVLAGAKFTSASDMRVLPGWGEGGGR